MGKQSSIWVLVRNSEGDRTMSNHEGGRLLNDVKELQIAEGRLKIVPTTEVRGLGI